MPNKLTILIIEEREADFIRLKDCIGKVEEYTAQVIWKNNYDEGAAAFIKEDVDICFLDAHLGEATGTDFLNDLKKYKEHVPIILVGNKKNDDLEEISEDDGIDDFITRQLLSPELLKRSLRYGFENHKKLQLLRAQEEKYSKLFYNSTEAIFTADKNFKIIEANQSFKDLIHLKSTVDLDFRNLFVSDDYDALFISLESDHKKNIKRTKIVDNLGQKRDVYVSIAKINAIGEEACYQGIIHDITDLEQAQKKVIETDNLKLISRMARIIGHEVRNPLTNIVLATEELKEDFRDNEEVLFMLEMIHRNSDRISGLIDNFLHSTKNSALQKEEVGLHEIVAASLNNCEDRIVLKKIAFKTTGTENKLKIYVDKSKFVIAITNLLINAIEALEKIENPSLELDIKTTNESLSIRIKDNGVGMTEETKTNLFNPFYSSKQGGLGLGMTNVNNIVNAHQGTIELESTVNLGTTFNLKFPLDQG